jgi:hypothetical protein
MAFDQIDVTIVERLAPKSGPTSSNDYNATLDETINSLAQISDAWNGSLQPLLDTLPSGSTIIVRDNRTEAPNPFVNGFDGSQIYVDLTSTNLTDDGQYYNSTFARPYTIKEYLATVTSAFNTQIENVLISISQVSQTSGITTRQKQSIGARIFDATQTSASGSLDGITQTLSRNLSQVGLDISGSGGYLTGLGTQTLQFPILSQLSAIQSAHHYDPVHNVVDHSNLDIHTHAFFVVPAGAMDGINVTFLLPGSAKFQVGTLQVFFNGLQLRPPYYYAERGDRRGFTLINQTPPVNTGNPSDDWVWMHYIVGS